MLPLALPRTPHNVNFQVRPLKAKIADAVKKVPRKSFRAAQHSHPSVMALVVAMVCTLVALMKVKERTIRRRRIDGP